MRSQHLFGHRAEVLLLFSASFGHRVEALLLFAVAPPLLVGALELVELVDPEHLPPLAEKQALHEAIIFNVCTLS